MRPMRHIRWIFFICVSLFIWQSCRKDDEQNQKTPVYARSPEYYSGGTTTSFDASPSAYRRPLNNLGAWGITLHQQGDELFHSEFFPVNDGFPGGLGPLFIESGCGACHVDNGRGAYIQNSHQGLLLRLSIPGSGLHNEPVGVPYFGVQLQTMAVPGETPEGSLEVIIEDMPVVFPDGYVVVLKQPYLSVGNPYAALPSGYLRGGRLAPPVYGAGLLEAITDETLLDISDPTDADGDGISGLANLVWNKLTHTHTIGRFGWKASNPSILQQSAEAFNQDMGITSSVFPLENCEGQSNCAGNAQEFPDVSDDALNRIVYYLQTLAPPAPRNLEDPEVIRGRQLFDELKCSKCHLPEITTGIHSVPELNQQVIRPYTDLLLHEMGPGLGDGRPDYLANANEWRTPPLWGIGLTKLVFPGAGFLHDGRAATLEEAILWHAGEAITSQQNYVHLNAADRQALIRFLEAL